MRKVFLFVDISNIFYSMSRRFTEKRLDFAKLLDFAKEEGEVIRAVAYGAQMNDEADRFITYLHHCGYGTRYKEVKTYINGAGRITKKADWDVGIAIDIVKALDRADVIVLGSADGDMEPVVTFAKERGIRVVVVGCEISRDLREVADKYREIDELLLAE